MAKKKAIKESAVEHGETTMQEIDRVTFVT